MASIFDSINKVDGIVGEIAAFLKEQASHVDQLNSAVSSINTVTRHNAATSEESSSAASELSSHAEELAAMVSNLKLTNTPSTVVSGTPARAPFASTKNPPLNIMPGSRLRAGAALDMK